MADADTPNKIESGGICLFTVFKITVEKQGICETGIYDGNSSDREIFG